MVDPGRDETSVPAIRRGRFENPRSSETSIAMAAAMIKTAGRPLLLIGAGANRRHTCRVLAALIDRTGIPFFSTQMGNGVVDERHPLFPGNAALSSGDFLHRAFEAADLIINVGHDVVEKPPFLMKPYWFQVIHIRYITAAIDPVCRRPSQPSSSMRGAGL